MRRFNRQFWKLQHIAQHILPFIRGNRLARRRQRGGLLADDVLYRYRTGLYDILLQQNSKRFFRLQNGIHEDLFTLHATDAAEETDHRVLVMLRITMLRRPDEQLHLVLRAEQFVERLQIRIRLLQAAAFKEVITLTKQHHRLRSLCEHQIDHLQSAADHARRALLRIRRQFVFQIRQKACHMAAWSAHRQSRLVRPNPFRQRAAAGIAGHADAIRIDFRTRQQDIQCATSVPHAPSAKILAEQFQLLAHDVMRVAQTFSDAAIFQIHILVAFALLNRIIQQHDKTILRKSHAERLIRIRRLAFNAMSASPQHGRCFSLQTVWNIQVTCHTEVRTAVEGDFLNTIAVTLQRFRILDVQRNTFRPRAERLIDNTTDVLLVGDGVFLCFQFRQPFVAFSAHRPQPIHVVIQHHVTIAVLFHCLFSKRCRNQQKDKYNTI